MSLVRHFACSHHTVFSGAQQRAKYKLCGGWVPCSPLSVQSSHCVFSGAQQPAKCKLRERWGGGGGGVLAEF